jgi:biotin synthase
METQEIRSWLTETDPVKLEELWNKADTVRRQHAGDHVYLRAILEISNKCGRDCHYCGLRAANSRLLRYIMTENEILDGARLAHELGIGTMVLQAGEHPGLTAQWVAGIVRRIKQETKAAVTLSLGERTPEELALWKEAGADRYLLKFETSNTELFNKIHPGSATDGHPRVNILKQLHALGYEVGSGFMIGVPGQTYDDAVNDLLLLKELDIHMMGNGPFIANPDYPFGEKVKGQVPNDELMTYKVMALTRILCPGSNIPSTTALGTVNLQSGLQLGLQRGGNVLMPNLTHAAYKKHYSIYPTPLRDIDDARQLVAMIKERILRIGRTIGSGVGMSPLFKEQRQHRHEVSND